LVENLFRLASEFSVRGCVGERRSEDFLCDLLETQFGILKSTVVELADKFPLRN
jgi:hypothetical protein